MMKKTRKMFGTASGFTLLEMIVVLVIMGFMVAMIAPRFSTVGQEAVDTVCDTNNRGVRFALGRYQMRHYDGLPNNVISLVNQTAASTYVIPANGGTAEAPKSLADEFVERNTPMLHILSSGEADELINAYGIDTALIWNNANDVTLHAGATPMQAVTINPLGGMPVAMVGAGYNGSWQLNAAFPVGTSVSNGKPHGNPYWLYRIMLGLGPDNSLVEENLLEGAALCPGGIQNAAVVDYNYYVMIVPRLAATVTRLAGSGLPTKIQIQAIGEGEEASGATGQKKEVLVNAKQDPWAYDATCPEGHKWPETEEFWSVYYVSTDVF